MRNEHTRSRSPAGLDDPNREHPPPDLVRLGTGHAMRDWPGANPGPLLDNELRHPSVMLFGEERSGGQTMARWWMRRLRAEKSPFVAVQCTLEGIVDPPQLVTGLEPEGENRMPGLVRDLLRADNDTVAEKAMQAIREALPMGKPLTVFFMNAERLKPRYPGLIAFLRWENEQPGGVLHLRAILRRFPREDPITSFVADISHLYRFCPWTTERIIEVAASMKLTLDWSAAGELRRRTGGQPKLVDLCLQRLSSGDARPATAAVRAITEQMLRSPPPIVDAWQKSLEAVLQGQTELIPRFTRYVMGDSRSIDRDPPEHREIELYISGWVGPEEGRWGIRSWLHQGWARPVLNSLELRR